MVQLHRLQQFLMCRLNRRPAGSQTLLHGQTAGSRSRPIGNAGRQEENSGSPGSLQYLNRALDQRRFHPHGYDRFAFKAQNGRARVAFSGAIWL
jgi:hypothetical protein